ncbi:MAG TPA: response regulator transcription factor [Kineosporiaceae bacterium]|nr:response regulator transcription factor [Kineosporiaceae bacterium]
MARLLLVEDDRRIGSLVLTALRDQGHETSWCETGRSAIEAARTEPLDLVLLDLGLPDIDGTQVCRVIRSGQPEAVIIMLTARGEDMDVITGLEAGADDYVTKPFGMTVLLARVRAHLRRLPAWAADAEVLRCGDLDVEPGARRCTLGGRELPLRAKQFDLLERLARDAGRPVTRERLMADVWDENWFGSTKTLDVHIATLRQRLVEVAEQADDPVRPPKIVTVRGVGYQLVPPTGP